MPALVKEGYGERFSIGLLTSAGSLGILIPPSIPMIMYALVVNVSVAKIFMAGFLPGPVYRPLPHRVFLFRVEKTWLEIGGEVQLQRRVCRSEGWIVGSLPSFSRPRRESMAVTYAHRAAAVSVGYALIVELLIYRELKLPKLISICRDSAILSGCLLFILSCAMTFIWLLTVEQKASFVEAGRAVLPLIALLTGCLLVMTYVPKLSLILLNHQVLLLHLFVRL